MNTTDDKLESADDDKLGTQKSIIRQSLDEIASELGLAMRDTNLDYPVGLTVPTRGGADNDGHPRRSLR